MADMSSSLSYFVMLRNQFQVVVITANMECIGCRARVSRVVSKMTGQFLSSGFSLFVEICKIVILLESDFIPSNNQFKVKHITEIPLVSLIIVRVLTPFLMNY